MASAPAAPRPAFAAGETPPVLDKFIYLPSYRNDDRSSPLSSTTATPTSAKIPDYWLTEAKKLMVHYAHTSHGSQVLTGLEWLEDQNSKYNVDILPWFSGLPSRHHRPALLRRQQLFWKYLHHPRNVLGHNGWNQPHPQRGLARPV